MKQLFTLTTLICGLWTMNYGLTYAQNVGVDIATPLEKLDVAGGVRIGNTSNTNSGTIRFNSPNFQGYDGTQWVNFGGGTLTGSGTATRVAFWSGTSALSSNANLYWDNTNNRLGIGTTTPSGPIDVQTPTAGRYMRYHNAGNLSLYNPTGGFTGELRLGEGYGRPGLYSSGRLELQSETTGIIFANSNVEYMRMTSSGNFGVGITNPSAKISAGSSFGNKVLAYDDGTNGAGLGIQAGVLQMFTSNNTSSIVFGYGSSGSFTENVRFMGTGNVGIGTTSPVGKLHVYETGTALAGWFQINNSGSSNSAVAANSNGSGSTIYSTNNGWGRAGSFEINNPSSDRFAVYAATNGVGPAIYADKAGSAGNALKLQTGSSSNASPTIYSNTFGTGYAGEFRIDNSGSSSAALYASTSGTGPAIEAAGKTKTTTFQMTSGATNGYLLQGDGSGNATWVNPTSLSITETDPQVSSTTTNYIPKWNGTTLVDGVGYDNGTNVGIGTTAPDYKLHVSGSDYLTLKLVAPNSPLLKLSSPNYNGGNGAEFWQDNTGDARLNINGTLNAIYMKSSGDVGIGMVFPNTPAARLDVNNGTSTVPIFVARDNGTEVMRIADGGNVGIGTTAPVNKLDIEGGMAVGATYSGTNTAPTNGAIIEGNVGIGTTSPSGPIHVNTSTAGRYMRYHQFGNLSLYNPNGSPAVELRLGEAWGRPGLSSSVQLELQSGTTGIIFGNNNVEYMRMDASGNLGIGTTAPGAYLDINGTNAGTTSLQLRSGNSNVGTSSNQITLGYSGTETYRHAIKTRHNSGGAANNAIDFYVWKSGTDAAGTVGTEQVMTIDGGNGGSVGIGTTSPSTKLDVNGTVTATALAGAFDQSASGYTRIGNMQIAWGSITLASGQSWNNAGDLSYVLASQSISFPANFNAAPTVTFTPRDGQIAARSAYVTFYDPSTTGVSNIYLASPDPDHGSTIGVVVQWMAIGTWQ